MTSDISIKKPYFKLSWIVFASSFLFGGSYVCCTCFPDNFYLLLLTLITGALTLALALVFRHIYLKRLQDQDLKSTVNLLGASYTALAVVYLIMPFILTLLFYIIFPQADRLVDKYQVLISLGFTVITIYITGFPLVAILSRKIPRLRIEQRAPGLQRFIIYLTITAGLALAGSVIGTPVHLLLTMPFSSDASSVNNEATKLMLESNLIERVAVIGIMAPVFEELLFRKILIDRTIKYGQSISIFLSGLMFGLFHGNFQQFFFATLIGMLFATVYIRTGRVRYSILMHMAVNLTTSVITVTVLKKLYPYLDEINDIESLPREALIYYMIFVLWILILGLIAVTGIVLFFVMFKRIKPYKAPGEESAGKLIGQALSSPLFLSFTALCLTQFAAAYLPDIVSFFQN